MNEKEFDADAYEQQNDENNGEQYFDPETESTQSQMLHELIHPHFEDENDIINKELKISNLDSKSLSLIVEMSDIALQCELMGAHVFSKHLTLVRDSLLCASSSLKGFERQMQVTSINIHKLPSEARDKFSLFGSGRKEAQPERTR